MIRRKLGLESGLQKITEQQSYDIRYFGSSVLVEPDVKRIREAIRHLVGDVIVKGKERSLPKVTLRVLRDGVHFKEKSKKSVEQIIPIRKLSYDTFLSSNIELLALNHHMDTTPVKMECFVVWCETDDILKQVGMEIYSALREQHFRRVREQRKESRPNVLEASRNGVVPSDHEGPRVRSDSNVSSFISNFSLMNFELQNNEEQFLSPSDLSDDAYESDLHSALEDMLKIVEEEEIKNGLNVEMKNAPS